MNSRSVLLFSASWGLAGVVLGALFDHALAPYINHAVETALRYHQLYSVLIAALGLTLSFAPLPPVLYKRLRLAAVFFSAGSVLFCGCLYATSLSGPSPLVYGAPIGGLLMMGGWLVLASAALTRPR